jgi:hypothetical protein
LNGTLAVGDGGDNQYRMELGTLAGSIALAGAVVRWY